MELKVASMGYGSLNVQVRRGLTVNSENIFTHEYSVLCMFFENSSWAHKFVLAKEFGSRVGLSW